MPVTCVQARVRGHPQEETIGKLARDESFNQGRDRLWQDLRDLQDLQDNLVRPANLVNPVYNFTA
jgi:hypothetical protein